MSSSIGSFRRCWPTAMIIGVTFCAAMFRQFAMAGEVDFDRQIAPILVTRCLECHTAAKASGGLILAGHDGLKKGGDSGEVVVASKPDESLFLERIEKGEMPPAKQGKPQALPREEQALLRKWIAEGAAWPANRTLDLYERTSTVRAGRDWWSLHPVVRPTPPAIADRPGGHPIDAFILDSLKKAGMEPAPPADRRTQIKRVYFDLLGLPPSADEVEAFVRDESPQAYERLIEKLLDSPHFGERWARHWLDLVRFAETSGYERDQEKVGAWKYRDWVIRAINSDKPYDRFVVEQLAGDEVPEANEETVTATGFLRLGTWNDEPNDPQEYKYERLEDLVHVATAAFLGTTVKCARCHDHKFDPIPQTDYYRIAAAFWPGPIEPRGSNLLGGPSREELGYDVLGWTDVRRDPPPLHLLKKGEPKFPGEIVAAGTLSMVPALERQFVPPQQESKTTKRRLQLAEWIVDPKNPLTPRVFVNRLWQHHFGQGLVRTPDNYGFTGQKPTHPELLDWLADELVRGGWSAKHIHRLILTSRVYQQSSNHPRYEAYAKRDFGNRLWWRAERRRMDAEALRDAMLVASGRIDLRQGGPSFRPTISSEALEGLSRKTAAWQASPSSEQGRRSIYSYTQRSLLPPLMTTFDFCDTTLPCGQRDVSTVAPQALALLNGDFAHAQSEALADRIVATVSNDSVAQIRTAWRLALGRNPNPAEATAALEHLDRQRANFETRRPKEPSTPSLAQTLPIDAVLHLRGDSGVQNDEERRVAGWADQSGKGHDAAQSQPESRPTLVRDAFGGRPALRFTGQRQFLHLAGQVLSSQRFTIVAVARDNGKGSHREIFSNWNGAAGNSVSSVFLGTTGNATVRFSDDFGAAGEIVEPSRPFLLTAVAGEHEAAVFQNDQPLARKSSPLAPRVLTTPFVVGQQGNIDGEFWSGDIAELLVYDRALTDAELRQVWGVLSTRYGLAPPPRPFDPAKLALASLCHVLLNSNEFVYVD